MNTSDDTRRNFLRTFAIGTAGVASSVATVASAKSVINKGAEEIIEFRRSFGYLWSRIASYTVEVANAMPEEHYDFKPVPEVRSFKEEMLHLANSDFWINNYFGEGKGTGSDYEASGKSKADCVRLVESSFEHMSGLISGLSDADLKTRVDTFAGEMTRMDVLWFMRDHITHHRAKLVASLRLKGITPPSYVGS
ncbi:MAG: DinB family protein [Bacteroidetes bacterium]|nr:MAG: DinB family protein [Bacteroidota bacterium]